MSITFLSANSRQCDDVWGSRIFFPDSSHCDKSYERCRHNETRFFGWLCAIDYLAHISHVQSNHKIEWRFVLKWFAAAGDTHLQRRACVGRRLRWLILSKFISENTPLDSILCVNSCGSFDNTFSNSAYGTSYQIWYAIFLYLSIGIRIGSNYEAFVISSQWSVRHCTTTFISIIIFESNWRLIMTLFLDWSGWITGSKCIVDRKISWKCQTSKQSELYKFKWRCFCKHSLANLSSNRFYLLFIKMD